jgi:uncharacterized protein YchJ
MNDDAPSRRETGSGPLPAPAPLSTQPLVTVIVRSMDRPELDRAVASIALQDYPAIETIVVDATGGRHRPLCPPPRRAGHTIRMVDAGTPLQRSQAASLGLASASGEWFTYLDDDDTCDPSHVSALVAAANAHPSALVVYGRARLFHSDGTLDRTFGRRFNRALMHFGPLLHWQAALIRTRVRELECRLDPAFEICEDRDFLAQIAEHGDFVYVPELATFNYRPDLGTSGTGNAANRDNARVARFENLLRAKWAGQGIYHTERAAVLCRQGVRAFFAEDLDASSRAFAATLALYPDDPNALHGLARIALARGDRALAERHARAAIEINPAAAEYRETLAAIMGPTWFARSAASRPVGRMASCPCGSGRRYKECCGRIAAAPRDASHAKLCSAAQFALDRGDATSAWEHVKGAAAIRCDANVGRMLERCCTRLTESRSKASLWSMALRLRADAHETSPARPPRRITIVDASPPGSAGARQAALLSEVLAEFAEVDTATEVGLATDGRGRDRCVVFIDPDTLPEHGVQSLDVQRIVIRMPRDDPAALVRSFARLAGAACGAAHDFTLPHAGLVDAEANRLPIEYPWIDGSLLRMSPPDPRSRRPLVVGRHGPGETGEDHPDDLAFYLRLERSGHRIAVPRTESLSRLLHATGAGAVSLPLAVRESGPALDEIDLFFYRGDPNYSGYADRRLLEAMAAARVVIVFPYSVGAREWIVDGENGFVVASEDDAVERIAELAANPQRLRRIGLAAREFVTATMRRQRRRALAFYLSVNLNE